MAQVESFAEVVSEQSPVRLQHGGGLQIFASSLPVAVPDAAQAAAQPSIAEIRVDVMAFSNASVAWAMRFSAAKTKPRKAQAWAFSGARANPLSSVRGVDAPEAEFSSATRAQAKPKLARLEPLLWRLIGASSSLSRD